MSHGHTLLPEVDRTSGRGGHLVGLLAFLVVAGWSLAVPAKTTIQGGNLGSRTWTPANDPYVIEGDIKIPTGSTLEIAAGVEVRNAQSDDLQTGQNPNKVEWNIQGTLTVAGTRNDPVTIRGVQRAAESWHEIRLGDSSNATIEYAEIRHANDALRVNSSQKITVRQSTFENNYRGILVNGHHSIVESTTIADNEQGLAVADKHRATIRASEFRNNQSSGLSADGKLELFNSLVVGNGHQGVELGCDLATSVSQRQLIHSTTIYNNSGEGIEFYCNDANSNVEVVVQNAIVAANGPFGIEHEDYKYDWQYPGTVTVSYSNVWDHSKQNYSSEVDKGSGNISSKPLFQNPPTDLHLKSTSLVIDAGTSKGAPMVDFDGAKRPADGDANGSADYDMGAYEYGASGVCGDGKVGPGESCDDGNDNGMYGHCNNNCDGQAGHCGDGTVDGPEACDDGNTTDGDGCSSSCEIEGNDAIDAGDAGDAGDTFGSNDAVDDRDTGADTIGGDGGPTGDAATTDTGAGTGADAGTDTGGGDTTGGTGGDAATTDTGGGNGIDTSGTSADADNDGSGNGCGCGMSGAPPVGGLGLFVLGLLLLPWSRRTSLHH